MALFLVACSTPATHDATAVALIDNFEWKAAETDSCGKAAHGTDDEVDGFWYTVQTRECPSLTVTQPLLVDVPEGATLTIVQFQWVMDKSSEALLRLAVGDEELVTRQITGPATTATLTDSVVAPRDFQAGESVSWSVNDDGNHTWSIVSFTLSY